MIYYILLMNLIVRTLERIFLTLLALAIIWLLVLQIFARLDQRLPAFLAFALTYFIGAYLLMPRVIQVALMILRRGRIPRFARARDGLPSDPINILLIGSERDLKEAFAAAQWHEADPLNIRTGWKMIHKFLENKPYPRAPFSSLYLFGRRQDQGFQQAIGTSPRKRHHVRFWAANMDPDVDWTDIHYWIKKHPLKPTEAFTWVGSATKDIGLGFSRLSYQITHSTDRFVDEERNYIFSSLKKTGWVQKYEYIESGKFVVGKYVSDGRVLVVHLQKPK